MADHLTNHGDLNPKGVFSDGVWAYLAARLSLSDRELQVTRGVFEDKKSSVIARTLRISEHTVQTYLERVYHKLRVHTRVQLIVRITECHLLFCQEPDSPLPPICHRRAAGECPFCD